MSAAENQIQRDILLALGSRDDVGIFRNFVGEGWVCPAKLTRRLHDGSVLLLKPRHVTFGLAVGSHDLIGWHSRVITEADLGRRFAQFMSQEVKTPTGRATKEQLAWAEGVRAAGGIAAIVRSPDEALATLGGCYGV